MASSIALNLADTTMAKVLAGNKPESQSIYEYLVETYAGKEFTIEDLHADEELEQLITPPKKIKATQPKKPRKVAKSSEERTTEEYDADRCDCRVWLNGFGGQCASKKMDGCTVCKTHQKKIDEDSGGWWLGMVTEPRPENPVRPGGSGKAKVWKTSESGEILEKPVKPKKPKMSQEEKEALKEQKKAEREALKAEKKAEREALKEQKKKEKEEEKEQKRKAKEEEKEQKKKAKKDEEVENSDETITEIHCQEVIPKVEGQDTLSDEEDEENEYDEIVYEGIEYQCHKESKEVLDPEDFSVMGTWNTKTESIVWEDDEVEEKHENAVREQQGLPIPEEENEE